LNAHFLIFLFFFNLYHYRYLIKNESLKKDAILWKKVMCIGMVRLWSFCTRLFVLIVSATKMHSLIFNFKGSMHICSRFLFVREEIRTWSLRNISLRFLRAGISKGSNANVSQVSSEWLCLLYSSSITVSKNLIYFSEDELWKLRLAILLREGNPRNVEIMQRKVPPKCNKPCLYATPC